jgi:uncharacterized Tic20 family protein
MSTQDKPIAVVAETLFLVNLLLLPGLAFLALLVLFVVWRERASPLVTNHLVQTVGASLVGGALIVCVIALVLALGGFGSGYTWMVVVLYFTCVHSSLILMGVMGLVKAMAGQRYRYPVVGRWFGA